MPKRSEEHKAAVRRRILDAARECLERNGYQDVTTREVLAEAGISTGTLYHYFPSKELLYEALATEALARDVEVYAARGTGDAATPGLLRLLEQSVLSDPAAAAMVSSLRSQVGGPLANGNGARHPNGTNGSAAARVHQTSHSNFSPLVRESVDDGFLRADVGPEALVELVDLIWDGMGRRAAAGTFQTSYGRVARALVQVLLDGAVSPARRSEVPNV